MVGSVSILLALLVAEPSAPPPEGYCIHCHSKEADERLSAPTASIAASVHATLEGGCVVCHGGDAREPTARAHEPSLGFRGKPTPKDVPRVCGGCHSDPVYMRRYSPSVAIDQAALYRASEHGKQLADGNERVATCVSCHGSHGIRKVADPRSPVHPTHVAATCGRCHSDPEHPASKVSKRDPQAAWRKSVHAEFMRAGDVSAPTCNDCHGDHGAAPPGLRNIHNACGACHYEQAERFQRSVHQEPYARLGFGECDECHGRHDIVPAGDFMLSTTDRGVCQRCHAEGEKGRKEAALLRERIRSASERVDEIRAAIAAAKSRGLSIPEAEMKEAQLLTALRRLRIAVHDMTAARLDPEHAIVMNEADAIMAVIRAADGDIEFRRRGYAAFIVCVLTVTLLLGLKLRRLPE